MAYLVEAGRLSPGDAYKARHGEAVDIARARPTPITPPATCLPPGEVWQGRAMTFVVDCIAAMWTPTGDKARAWLHGRGLDDATLDAAGIGYNEADHHEARAAWGLADGKDVWTPRGIVIPWMVGPDLWRVNIRRPVGKPKYIGPAGWANALYNADALTPDKPAIMVEGELDALTIVQHAGDLVTPVATGSTDGARRARWLARLALCPVVLVAFDADDAGAGARQYWTGSLANARAWRPYWGDANSMATGGADLRGWILAGIEAARPGLGGGL